MPCGRAALPSSFSSVFIDIHCGSCCCCCCSIAVGIFFSFPAGTKTIAPRSVNPLDASHVTGIPAAFSFRYDLQRSLRKFIPKRGRDSVYIQKYSQMLVRSTQTGDNKRAARVEDIHSNDRRTIAAASVLFYSRRDFANNGMLVPDTFFSCGSKLLVRCYRHNCVYIYIVALPSHKLLRFYFLPRSYSEKRATWSVFARPSSEHFGLSEKERGKQKQE